MQKQNKYRTLFICKEEKKRSERWQETRKKHMILGSLDVTTTTEIEPYTISPPQTTAIMMNVF